MADTEKPRRIHLRRVPTPASSPSQSAPERDAGPSQPRHSLLRSNVGRQRSAKDGQEEARTNSPRMTSINGTGGSGRKPRQSRTSTSRVKNEAEQEKKQVEQIKEPEEDPEERQRREKHEQKLHEQWAEEYNEIVEQLPLELHRTFTLMRELEGKVHSRMALMASHSRAYRDARFALRDHQVKISQVASSQGGQGGNHDDEARAPSQADKANADDSAEWTFIGTSSDADADGEEDVELAVGGAQPKWALSSAAGSNNHSSNASFANEEQTDTASTEEDLPIEVPTRASRLSLLASIAKASAEASRAADEKVGLAVTAYDWVDRHIRRLDADLQKSESSLLLGLRAGTEASRGLQDALGLTQASDGKDAANSKDKAHGGKDIAGLDESGFVGDMDIDPNEPRYCYCDQVSFGDMVACDNEDCPREWFHYECIGLTMPPRGKWFCLFCAPPGFKGSGTFPPHAPCLPQSLQSSHAAASGRGRTAKRANAMEADADAVQASARATGSGTQGHKRVRSRTSTSNAASVRVPKRKA